MCIPNDARFLEKIGSELLRNLVKEIHGAWGSLLQEPRFVDNPVGYRLCDMESNVNHATLHLHSACEIISILLEGEFIKEKGGEP